MSQQDTFLVSIYSLINMLIPIIIGFVLSKLGVLTEKTRGVVSHLNYYAFAPIYVFIFIMQAIDKNSLTEMGLVLFSSLSSVFIGFLITLGLVLVLGGDVRSRFSYTFIQVYQNAVVMPQMLAESLCDEGAKYATTPTCKNKLTKSYCALPCIYVNILYWVTVLPTLQAEKKMSNEIKKIFAIVLNYYDKIDNFLKDKDFTGRKQVAFGSKCIEITTANVHPDHKADPIITARSAHVDDKEHLQTEAALVTGSNEGQSLHEPIKIEDPRFIEEYYGRRIDKADYNLILERFAEFEEKVFNKSDQEGAKKAIEDCVLKPHKLLEKPIFDDIWSLDFYKRRIIYSPPAIWSLIGLVLGFIFPFKEWFFDTKNKPLPTFISTLQTVGAMLSPFSMFLLGTYIAQASTITPDMFIRWKHIILSNLIRNLILPLFGYLWVFVVLRNMVPDIYENNPILMFLNYTYWIVPNGIILIAVYVVADYFAKEFAIISIYMNLVSIPMMAIYLIIYFLIRGD